MLGIKSVINVSKYYLVFFVLGISPNLIQEKASSQVIPDGTLGTEVDLIDQKNNISGGQERGANLFHSFQEFSPLPETGAYFNNNPNIENIFSRVTGGIPSIIDGVIETNDASLFLINPSGIIFKGNAQLNMNGSFFATTAEQVIFADGTTFNANISNTSPLLTVSIPVGLQYGNNPGAIAIDGINRPDPIDEEGFISLNNGIIALLGGEINFKNTIISDVAIPGIEIAGIGEGETINLSNSDGTWVFDYSDITNFKNVNIGPNVFIDSAGETANINIQGKNIILNNSFIINSNTTNNPGGNISLTASDSIQLNQSFLTTQSSELLIDENFQFFAPSVEGSGGDISLTAREIIITEGSQIVAGNFSEGKGGSINLNVEEYLEISGVGNVPTTDPSGELIAVNSLPSSIAVTVGPTATKNGGNINIKTNQLNISDGARIDTSTTGFGNAGVIDIEATSIEISDVGEIGFVDSSTGEIIPETLNIAPSSIAANVEFASAGKGGNINIRTNQLNISNGGRIDSSTEGSGDAGMVTVNSLDSITISGKNGELHSGIYASSEDQSKSNQLLNSSSNSNSIVGTSGNLKISTSELFLRDQGIISVENNSDRDAGNIKINADILFLFDNSKIIARAGAGRGGNITINTKGLFPFNAIENNQIDASSDLGIDGEITIADPEIDSKINASLKERKPIAPEKLIYSACGLNSDFTANQFRYIGRGGISPSPLTVITEDIIGELGTVEYIQKKELENTLALPVVPEIKDNSPTPSEDTETKLIQEATTWKINDRGNIELVAQSPVLTSLQQECPLSNK